MKKCINCVACLLVIACSFAQGKPYDVSSIPAALLKNATSVKREERIVFEVKSISKATLKSHSVVTVLNEKGKDELSFHAFTDQFRTLENITMQLFDATGAPLQKYKRSDLSKQTAGEGLVPDGQVYYIEFPVAAYPVTLMVDYEIRYTGLLHYPNFDVLVPEQSVQQSSFVAIAPTDLDIRYKAININLQPAKSTEGTTNVYTWSVNNLPTLAHEIGSVSYESRYPRVLLSPTRFELDGYAGDMTSWESFGSWYGSLSKKADNLSETSKSFLKNLVKDARDDREKTKIIYEYLQSNFRYVSIQLGIGGFKPFDADFVDKKKYGDCKALSNYMVSCLNAVGINSFQALINAAYNKQPVDPAFPHNSFNHVIVCVPLQKDSIWLECTSNTSEFGVLGNFTENRNALLITANGGKLVPTPKSNSAENVFASHTLVELGPDGTGKAKISLQATGEYKQELMHYLGNQKKDEQKQYLVNYIGYMQPDEFDVSYDAADKKAATTMNMYLGKVPEFIAGSKMFLNPRMYKIWSSMLPTADNRTQDFYFEHPFIKADTTIYQLPTGFAVETLPKGKSLECTYGKFNSSYAVDASKQHIISVARLELNQHKIPADKFQATKTFFNEVLGEYTEKIVIKKL